MRRTMTIFFAVLLTATAALPLAAAGWKFRGTNEPDTSLDVDYMWASADQTGSTEARVYFSGFQHSTMLWLNPNAGALGSRMQQYGSAEHSALLGVWKDCNKDGYIGFGEAGLFEYRAELLTDTSICPEQTVNPDSAPSPYPYNDGGWIREFNWIGDHAPKIIAGKAVNPTYRVVPGTQVWFDWGLPNSVPGTSCPITGGLSVRNVGLILKWGDCFTNYQTVRTLNTVQDATGLPVGGWDTRDLEHSDAELNKEFPGWNELYGPDGDGFGSGGGLMTRDHHDSGDRADRAVTVWDCTDNKKPQAKPSTTVNPGGSVYEPANETYNIATKGSCKTDAPDSTSNNALPFLTLDSRTNGTSADAGKSEVSDLFIFSQGNRRAIQGGGGALGPFAPVDGGLALERDTDVIGMSWRANTGWTTTPMLVNRDGLEPTGAIYLTYYAKLGDTAGLAWPQGTTHTYGPEACAAGKTGLDAVEDGGSGWWCDEEKWLETCNQQGADVRTCVTVGEDYHLRDVDCWDNRVVAGVPVYLSLVALSESGPCQDGPQKGIE